jgi:hypothetical protein
MNHHPTLTLGNYIGKSHETSKITIMDNDDKTVVVDTTDSSCAAVVGKSQPRPYLSDFIDPFPVLQDDDESTALDISPCRPSRKLSKANLSSLSKQFPSHFEPVAVQNKTSCHTTPREFVSSIHTDVQIDDDDDDETTTSCTSSSSSSSSISTSSSGYSSSSSSARTICGEEKRVRFRVVESNDRDDHDDDDEIVEEIGILSYPRHDLTPNDKRKAWWNKLERRRMKQSVPDQCEYAIYKHPTYRRVAFQTMTLLNHISMEDLQEQLQIANNNNNKNSNHHHPYHPPNSVLRESVPILVQSDSRGLERAMMKRLQLPRPDVKAHVYSVLRHQQSLQQYGWDMSEDEKQIILAGHAAADSEWARKWAWVMAQGDAQDVHGATTDDDSKETGALTVQSRVKRVIRFL